MRILDYPRHFLLLGGGAMALAGMTRLPSLFAGGLLLLFGVVGALHAMAVVLGLRSRPSWPACLGFVAAAGQASRRRSYQEGQSIYLRECEPWKCASIVIDNDDLAAPFVVFSEQSF